MKILKIPLAIASIVAVSYINPFYGSLLGPTIQRNSAQGRIHAHQNNANIPIEDRFDFLNIKQKGYGISVYDGHGGHQVAQFAKNQLLKTLNSKATSLANQSIQNLLKMSFADIEQRYSNAALTAYRVGFGDVAKVGSCALVAIVKDNEVITANAGDCRGIIINQDKTTTQINKQHNAARPQQQQKLKKAFPDDKDIIKCVSDRACYVKGRLQPTRSLGDLGLKHQNFNNPMQFPTNHGFRTKIQNFKGNYISAVPQILKFSLKPKDNYIVLATDGLWDQLSNQKVAQCVIKNKDKISQLPKILIDLALSQVAKKADMKLEVIKKLKNRALYDDMTVVVVNLQNQFI